MKPQGSFSLDRMPVERRAIGRREGIRLRLPLPPPTHVLFVDVPGVGRAPSQILARWKRDAWRALSAQPQRFLGGPVRVAIVVEDRGRSDLEARAKPILDFLVVKNAIEDDSRAIVRELTLRWGAVEGCEIAIDPLEAERTAR